MKLSEALRAGTERLEAAGIEEATLEAELLLRHALGLSREALFAGMAEDAGAPGVTVFQELLARRVGHDPTAYIVGQREFYGLQLECTPAALIPRPETELLVEHALAWLRGAGRSPHQRRVVDVGTGNGAIAVALAANGPDADVVGVDVSRAALSLARRNAQKHRVADSTSLVQGDLLGPLRGEFDVVVANLPYVPTRLYRQLPPEIQQHEPERALHAGRRGTAPIEALLEQAAVVLRRPGLLLAEHAWNQGRSLREAAAGVFPNAAIETRRDLAGLERMLVVETK